MDCLNIQCHILEDYLQFIQKEYLKKQREDELSFIPKSYRALVKLWQDFELSSSDNIFYKYILDENNVFECEISKNVNDYEGDLWEDYLDFIRDIIVPISDEILYCKITSDYDDHEVEYTDLELRNQPLYLKNIVNHVEHIYDEDNQIVETRVILAKDI